MKKVLNLVLAVLTVGTLNAQWTYKTVNNNVNQYLLDETQIGIYDSKTYNVFTLKTNNIISNLKLELTKMKNESYKCIGFGAAAKGQTVLCYGEIFLDYIIDENPLKIGLLSPKMNIPIVDINHFINDTNNENNKFVIVILAWNFAAEIKEKIKKRKGEKEIIIIEAYFPEIIISKIL